MDMDLFARIQAQNAEIDNQGAQQYAEMRFAEQDQYAAAAVAYSSHAGPPPPTQQFNVVRIGGSRSRRTGDGAANYQQNYGGSGGLGGGGGRPQAPTEATLRMQERELDRQLELERSLQRGGEGGGGARGPPGGMMARRAANGGSASRNKLQMPPAPSEKENRGKISLLPPGGGGAPPSTSGGASRYAPSYRGGPAPSVSGMTTASERARRPIHFSHLMDRDLSGQMDGVLNPVDGIRGQMKRAGIEPKDHHRDNRRQIKEMQEMKRQQAMEKQQQEEDKKLRAQRLRDHSLAKAQNKLHALSEEGAGFDHPPIGRGQGAASAGRRSMRPAPSASDDPQNLPPPPRRAHQAGAVPAYLQRRKAEWQATAEEQAARERAEAECPPGLRLVGPEEKQRILEKLAEERAKATVELRNMPFVIKTQSSQAKKDALEKRLEEIDGAEEAYMREKVFVPADM